MKYGFLGSKTAFTVIGLILGLYGGFKIANSQHRLLIENDLNRSIAGVTGGANGSASADQNGAIEQTRQIIDKARTNPHDIEAQLDAADQFIQISRPDQALPFLQQAHEVDQKDARVLAGLGMANFMTGKYREAIDWASQSLAINSKNPGASFLLIASYIRTNQKLDEAERLIRGLEADGIDPAMVGKVREELDAARGTKPGTRTMLEHGPEEKSPATRP